MDEEEYRGLDSFDEEESERCISSKFLIHVCHFIYVQSDLHGVQICLRGIYGGGRALSVILQILVLWPILL